MTLEELRSQIQTYNPEADLEIIRRAHDFADRAHQGQKRLSGDSHLSHCLEVAGILASLKLDLVTIAAGLLHDVVEDTQISLTEVEDKFGREIASLVEGVTKIGTLHSKSDEEHQAENMRKMFLAMAKDIRVILIKLADRLHNMRTLGFLPPEKVKYIADETLEIYAPLAHRLGIARIKWELEDLSLRYLRPDIYYDLVEKVASERQEREKYIEEIKKTLEEKLKEVKINAQITGRPKHFYSIYRKMQTQGKNFDEIYDLTAIRVLTDSVRDCYASLGVIHALWTPLPGRFKDYIATPKSNMYQSLHTTVIGPAGSPLEIQVRTRDMHKTAEEGIAAHWRYKEGGVTEKHDMKFAWLRQLLEWQQDLKDPREFMEALKIDLFADEVFVFTPRGDVKELPRGATPVDFAYMVHTDIGNHCIGAKVNGKIVPLRYELKHGDVVEIITSPTHGPSWDWLKFVKTSRARSKIRHRFKMEEQERSIALGRANLEKELIKNNLDPKVLKSPELLEVAKRLGYVSLDDLLANIGYGKVSTKQIIAKFLPSQEGIPSPISHRVIEKKDSFGVRVEGMGNMLIRFAKCCNPVPGDRIVGYITRGRGVSIHRMDCLNVGQLLQDSQRKIEAWWDGTTSSFYEVEFEVEAYDRANLMADILTTIAATRTIIKAANGKATPEGRALCSFTIEISNLNHLQSIMANVEKVKGVIGVRRAP